MGHFWAGVTWWACIVVSAAWIVFGMDIIGSGPLGNAKWWRVFASLFFVYLILCTCGVTPYG